MPVYNGEPFIREALDSLLEQTFTDYELIISDNASTDNTETICREYAAKDLRIKYIRQLVNKGATENFRLLVDQASAEYFMWSAADDKIAPEFLRVVYETISSNEEIVLAMTDVQNIARDGAFLGITRIENIRIEAVLANWTRIRRLFFENPTSNIFFCVYGMYRTKVIRSVQLNYKEKVKYAAASEVPLLAQVSLLGKVVAIPSVLKMYRRHEDSVYHSEAKRITFFKDIHNKVNVSFVLFDILIHSSLTVTEKILNCGTIAFTFLRFVPGAVVRAPVRWLRANIFNR